MFFSNFFQCFLIVAKLTVINSYSLIYQSKNCLGQTVDQTAGAVTLTATIGIPTVPFEVSLIMN